VQPEVEPTCFRCRGRALLEVPGVVLKFPAQSRSRKRNSRSCVRLQFSQPAEAEVPPPFVLKPAFSAARALSDPCVPAPKKCLLTGKIRKDPRAKAPDPESCSQLHSEVGFQRLSSPSKGAGVRVSPPEPV
jgi:hypothetical protein